MPPSSSTPRSPYAIRSRLLRVRTLAIDSASVACRTLLALTVADASRGAPCGEKSRPLNAVTFRSPASHP